jgi:hypothetical protein
MQCHPWRLHQEASCDTLYSDDPGSAAGGLGGGANRAVVMTVTVLVALLSALGCFELVADSGQATRMLQPFSKTSKRWPTYEDSRPEATLRPYKMDGPCTTAHSHREAGICTCDDGYIRDPLSSTCVPR